MRTKQNNQLEYDKEIEHTFLDCFYAGDVKGFVSYGNNILFKQMLKQMNIPYID